MLPNSQYLESEVSCFQQKLITGPFRMLHEFHCKQNEKKPGSVHATYIITGTKVPSPSQDPQKEDPDGDSVMQSSPPLPPPSSSAAVPQETEPITIQTMMLVKEEHLERAKSQFISISCIHVYALAAKGLSQIQTLAECNRKITAAHAGEDPLVAWKAYGTIQNSNVRRRTARVPPAPVPAAAVASKPVAKEAPAAKTATTKPDSKESTNSTTTQKAPAEMSKSDTAKSSKVAPSKASASSIFKSFAKTAPVTKKPAPTQSKNDSQASAASVQDTNMTGFSDDDDEADDASLPEELFAKDSQAESSGKSKKDREAELQAMMEQDDDEDEEAAKSKADGEDGDQDAEMDDADALESQDSSTKKADAPEADVEEEEPKVIVQNGRRRGKRRVPKKRTVRDEEGYLGKNGQSLLLQPLHRSNRNVLKLTIASLIKSLKRNLPGSPSPKRTLLRPRQRPRRRPRFRTQHRIRTRARLRQRGAPATKVARLETSCRSLERSDDIILVISC
jgi:DNA polymerase delta subunit 3